MSEQVDFSQFNLDESAFQSMLAQMQSATSNNSTGSVGTGSVGTGNTQLTLQSELTFDETFEVLKKYTVYMGEYCDNPIIGTGTVSMGMNMFKQRFITVGIEYYAPFGASEYTLKNLDFTIGEFNGKKRLNTHEVVPIFDPETNEEVMAAIARGTQFVEYTRTTYYGHANGYMYVPIRGGFNRLPIDSRVVVDPTGYKRDHANRWHDKDTMTEIPGEYIYATMPTVPVFSLEYRMWGEVPVVNLGDIQFDKTAFDRTVLPQDYKDTIRPLVENFYKTDCIDFIAGKKKGLTILMGGKPGTGKTLTANSIAELCEKPLYCVGSGDLGTKPDQIDTNLKRIFSMVEKWGGMVLIDEADVFMSRRTDYNVDYNACVSVFLRLVEEYMGILFLTTNKEHVKIDPAFDSRVHIRLHYHELDAEGRAKVWTEALSRYHINNIDVSHLCQHKLNNREIANLVQIAYVSVGGSPSAVTQEVLARFVKLRLDFDPTEEYDTFESGSTH